MLRPKSLEEALHAENFKKIAKELGCGDAESKSVEELSKFIAGQVMATSTIGLEDFVQMMDELAHDEILEHLEQMLVTELYLGETILSDKKSMPLVGLLLKGSAAGYFLITLDWMLVTSDETNTLAESYIFNGIHIGNVIRSHSSASYSVSSRFHHISGAIYDTIAQVTYAYNPKVSDKLDVYV